MKQKGEMSDRLRRRANRRERRKPEPLPDNPEYRNATWGIFLVDAVAALKAMFKRR